MRTDKYIFEETKPNQFEGDSSFPEQLEIGKVYFYKEWSISVHLCPCGCGDKVYLPFKETNVSGEYWGLSSNTFTPSIFKRLGCKSHYFIKNGLVQWC